MKNIEVDYFIYEEGTGGKIVKTKNKAAIMVTHDERMLSFCDRVYQILMEQKELITV